MKTIRFQSSLNLTASGKQRRFKIHAYSGGVLKVDGFAAGVVVDLSGLEIPGSIPILIDHRSTVETTLGLTDSIVNDGRSLTLNGQVTGQSALSQQVLAQAANGHTWQASIGASVIESEEIAAGQSVVVNGQRFVGPVIVARRSVLKETSVLPMGADSSTSVNLAAKAVALKGSISMTFSEWLKSLGIDEAMMTPEGTAIMQTQYDLIQNPPDGAPVAPAAQAAAVLDLRATASHELNRQSQILASCVGFPHIAETGIRNGWSVLECENHILKAKARSMTPSNRTIQATGAGLTKDALSASLLIRAGAENVALKAFGAQNCEIGRAARITNLVDLAAAALRLNGQDPQAHQNNDQMLRAAFSTASLGNILGDSVGKSLVAAYEETTTAWRTFCHIGDAQSFRDQTGIRPAAIASLEEVGAGGVIKHGTLAEEDTFTWSVGTFAKMLSITRTTIVNDDLNFISELAPMLGTAAGRSLNDLIWSTILGGQTANYFSSGNSNLATTASALAVETLGAGVAAMRNQRDDNGYDLNISPVALRVPPALELTARALLNSNDLLGTSGPNGNPVKGIVSELIVEPRISNSTRFDNATAIQWFLFASPTARPITVGFLRGQQTPTIETSDADFNTLGMQIRVYHDYGCALGDEKAGYKATGAGA